MKLDPQVQMVLDSLRAMGGPELHTLPVPEARRAMQALGQMQGEGAAVAVVESRTIPGPLGEIPIRVYNPAPQVPLPILLWFHGGGWVLGGLDTHDGVCRSLANEAHCLVVSVDYHLAPEAKFPAACEDCYAATAWVAANAAALGAEASRIAVGGDSAGGNLSAVVAQMARDRGGPKLAFQLLVYPVTDADFERASYRENAEGYMLTTAAMQWFWNHYTRDPAERKNPYAAPLQAASLAGLPPALVITAGFDPLRDEGEAYAAALSEAGVPTRLSRYEGMIHGFFSMGMMLDGGRRGFDEAAAALRKALG